MANLTITRVQLDALVAAGLAGDTDEVERLRDLVYAANDITLYRLSIRWQDAGGQPPPRIELGKGWPEDQTYLLELERAISRNDVDVVLNTQATHPVTVMVTPDPDGNVGWTLLEDYNFEVAT